ncbi:hypothetical protein pb186bvf_012514 [Paramecium bursaria]
MQWLISDRTVIESSSIIVGQENTILYCLQLPQKFTKLISELGNNASIKQFLNEIQDISSLIGCGLQCYGLITPDNEWSLQFSNISTCLKLAKIFRVSNLIVADKDLKGITFSIATNKQTQLVIQKSIKTTLIQFDLKHHINHAFQNNFDHNGYCESLKKKLQNEQIAINNKIILKNEQLSKIFLNQQQLDIKFLVPNQDSDYTNPKDNKIKLIGWVHTKFLVLNNLKIDQLQKIAIDQLIDVIKIKLETVDKQQIQQLNTQKSYLPQSFIISFKEDALLLQDYFQNGINLETYKQRIQESFPQYTIKDIMIIECQFQQQKQTEIIKEQILPQEIDISYQGKQKKTPLNKNIKYFIFSSIVIIFVAYILRIQIGL